VSTRPDDQTRRALALIRAYVVEDSAALTALAPVDTPALTALYRVDPLAAVHYDRDEREARALTHAVAAWAVDMLRHQARMTDDELTAALDRALALP
jgi:hypothetical protein